MQTPTTRQQKQITYDSTWNGISVHAEANGTGAVVNTLKVTLNGVSVCDDTYDLGLWDGCTTEEALEAEVRFEVKFRAKYCSDVQVKDLCRQASSMPKAKRATRSRAPKAKR